MTSREVPHGCAPETKMAGVSEHSRTRPGLRSNSLSGRRKRRRHDPIYESARIHIKSAH